MAPMKPFFLIGGLTSTPGTLTGGIPATLAPAMASEVWVAIVLFRFSSRASSTTFAQLVDWVTKNQPSKDFKHEDRSWTTRSYIYHYFSFLFEECVLHQKTHKSLQLLSKQIVRNGGLPNIDLNKEYFTVRSHHRSCSECYSYLWYFQNFCLWQLHF